MVKKGHNMSLKKVIYDLSPSFIKKIWRTGKICYLKMVSPKYVIVKKTNIAFKKVYKVKDGTWEDSYYPECYGHCKEQHLSVYSPEEYIFEFPNAVISNESDVVITEQGVYWDKFNDEEFLTWADPVDANVISYDSDSIYIKKRKQKLVKGRVLSMLGVWANHWGHCMYQFLPKLFTAGEAGLLNEPIKVLVPDTEDKTIIEIIKFYLASYPQAEIVYAHDGIDYKCEILYFMPTSGSNFNGSHFRLDYPYYISRHVIEKTKKYVINPIIAKIKDYNPKIDKLYLSRRSRRTATNIKEIDDFFFSQGFVEIEGAKLTLEQKAAIFYHAKEIVGMYGSGFLNLMFCNQAKGLVFTNYKMSTDTSIYIQIRDYVSDLINITGQDISSDYHTDTYYPIEKIKKAYFDRINMS